VGKKLIAIGTLLLGTCIAPSDEEPPRPQPIAGFTAVDTDADVRTEEDLREEQALLAEAEDIALRIQEGRPMPEEEEAAPLSAYQRWLVQAEKAEAPAENYVPAWLRLARWSMSEGSRDMEALLQMAYNLQKPGESIGNTICNRAKKVCGTVEATAGRQLWTSTLSAKGNEPPDTWWECEGTKETKSGRKIPYPKGCHGFWSWVGPKWERTRDLAKKVIRTHPNVIPGVPIDQGGGMDVWLVVERRPDLCFIGQVHDKGNYFFGYKSDPRNKCLPISKEIVQRSKTVSATLVIERARFQQERLRVRQRKTGIQ